jgi:RsiW-degrading membrane proteinase PrsW (M82 family)
MMLSDLQKKAVMGMGLLLALIGLPIAILTLLLIAASLLDSRAEPGVVLAAMTLLALTLGAGGIAFWHAAASRAGQRSSPLRLPPVWVPAGLFGLAVAAALVAPVTPWLETLILPPALLIAAALPPLWAVAWFASGASPARTDALTRRRGLVAFAGGATAGVALALLVEFLVPALVLALVADLAATALDAVDGLLTALTGGEIAEAITGPGFLYALIQLALVAPLAEELAKPLITLPLVRRMDKTGAFLVGAMAGAGFAALENVLYAGFGLSFGTGILMVRAIGGAIHPLGSGLMVLGWRGVLRGEPGAGRRWLERFGTAAGVHALWNGGALLVITLAGARFFGELPPEIDVLGLSAAGTTLAFLILLGLGALWLGKATVKGLNERFPMDRETPPHPRALSDRAVALWAVACLVALVPAGITGLKLILGGGP